MPAVGERRINERIVKGIPEDVKMFEGGVTMVVGSGASAITVVERILGGGAGGGFCGLVGGS